MRDWFWERLAYLAVALGIAALAVLAVLQSARPGASAEDLDQLWFARCELQADRYIVCSSADKRIAAALSANTSMAAGEVFGRFIADYFASKGCTAGGIEQGLRVNGVFFSWDTAVLANVSCGGKQLKVTFHPERMMIADIVALYLTDRP